jgi:trans-aconitate methyltransferase
MDKDLWLQPWLATIAERCMGTYILELGCGGGRDTRTLVEAGFQVEALDISAEAIAEARRRCPDAHFHCQDVHAAFPVPSGGCRVVLASLALHYFGWKDTLELAKRIHAALQPGGILLCRLNSTKDVHHGASGHPALERNYYLVDGRPKRFFDRAAVLDMFAQGWNVLSLHEQTIYRYDLPKVVWEAVLEKV